jgi:hypothetical protein
MYPILTGFGLVNDDGVTFFFYLVTKVLPDIPEACKVASKMEKESEHLRVLTPDETRR